MYLDPNASFTHPALAHLTHLHAANHPSSARFYFRHKLAHVWRAGAHVSLGRLWKLTRPLSVLISFHVRCSFSRPARCNGRVFGPIRGGEEEEEGETKEIIL